jgi:hypothetical protein
VSRATAGPCGTSRALSGSGYRRTVGRPVHQPRRPVSLQAMARRLREQRIVFVPQQSARMHAVCVAATQPAPEAVHRGRAGVTQTPADGLRRAAVTTTQAKGRSRSLASSWSGSGRMGSSLSFCRQSSCHWVGLARVPFDRSVPVLRSGRRRDVMHRPDDLEDTLA